MVVLVRSHGNHSNRLFQNLHIEAFCIDNNIPFFNATFYDMAWLYTFPYNYFLAFVIILFFKIAKFFGFIHYTNFDNADQLELYKQQLLRGRDRLVIVRGWGFRAFELVSKYSDFLKEKYSTKRTNKEFFLICNKIKEYEIVLGVHIRRRDYKKWHGGKYAFDDATYSLFISNFMKLQKRKKIIVLFFSDEDINFSSLYCPADYLVSKNKYYIDYQLMGKCNYLIGHQVLSLPGQVFFTEFHACILKTLDKKYI